MNTDNKRQNGSALTVEPKQTRHIDSPYLNPREAIEYLRIGSLTALYRLIHEQRLPYGRRGRLYIFDKRKLDRWVEMSGSGAYEFGRRKAS